MEIQGVIEERTYSSNEVCEILNEKKYNIIYMEKMLGLNINKDKLSHKVYTDKDIEILKRAKSLKNDEGYSYETIKKILLPSIIKKNTCGAEEELISPKEIIVTSIHQTEDSNSHNESSLEYLNELIIENINGKIEEIVSQKLDALKSYIENEFEYLRRQNTDIKTKMELDIENYANEVSIKIDSLKHSKEKKKKGFFR